MEGPNVMRTESLQIGEMTTGAGWDGDGGPGEELTGWERLAGRTLCWLVALSLLPVVVVVAVLTAVAELVLWCRRQVRWALVEPVSLPPRTVPVWSLRGDDRRRLPPSELFG
jgi:hypothetical protein